MISKIHIFSSEMQESNSEFTQNIESITEIVFLVLGRQYYAQFVTLKITDFE